MIQFSINYDCKILRLVGRAAVLLIKNSVLHILLFMYDRFTICYDFTFIVVCKYLTFLIDGIF